MDTATVTFCKDFISTTITDDSYYYPYYGMLALDPSSSNVYLSNYNDADGLNILKCPITNGMVQDNCSASPELSNSGWSYGAGIIVNHINTRFNEEAEVALNPDN